MKNKIISFLFYLFLPFFISAQNYQLLGELKPGSIIIGKGENIESVFLNDIQIPVDNGSIFILGFDRDAKRIQKLEVLYKNGNKELKRLNLAKRKYNIQKIRLSQKFLEPPKEVLEKIEREAEIMKSARMKIGNIDSALYAVGFIRPVKGGRVTSVFGSQRIINGIPKNIHNGVDIASPEGTDVYATSDGVVVIAGENFFYNGNFVLLDHGHGLSSVYLHLSKLGVKPGDRIKKGDKIGEIGTSGQSTGPHLHWGVQLHNKRIDPLSLLNIKL